MQLEGIQIVESLFTKAGTPIHQVVEYVKSKGKALLIINFLAWSKFVMKPAVGAWGRNLQLITMDDVQSKLSLLQALLDKEDFLVQPFLLTVMDRGETCVVMINEHYSHAIIKKHLQKFDASGVTEFPYESLSPDSLEVKSALNIFQAMKCHMLKTVGRCPKILYARVDFLYSEDGTPLLNELELIGTDK